jgi:hypothetical protein
MVVLETVVGIVSGLIGTALGGYLSYCGAERAQKNREERDERENMKKVKQGFGKSARITSRCTKSIPSSSSTRPVEFVFSRGFFVDGSDF